MILDADEAFEFFDLLLISFRPSQLGDALIKKFNLVDRLMV
jgi:hypothetical protein